MDSEDLTSQVKEQKEAQESLRRKMDDLDAKLKVLLETMGECQRTVLMHTKQAVDQYRSVENVKFQVRTCQKEMEEKKTEVKRQTSDLQRMNSAIVAMNNTVIERTETYDEKIEYYDELLTKMSSQLKICLCMDYEKADNKTVDLIK